MGSLRSTDAKVSGAGLVDRGERLPRFSHTSCGSEIQHSLYAMNVKQAGNAWYLGVRLSDLTINFKNKFESAKMTHEVLSNIKARCEEKIHLLVIMVM